MSFPDTLLLASTSPWRLQLLREVGLQVQGCDPGVDESRWVAASAPEQALLRARAKAGAVAARAPEAWVVGADQVLHHGGELFGKPTDRGEWRDRLRGLRGRRHDLVTAVALEHRGQRWELVEPSGVWLRADLDDAEIDAYIDLGEAAGCAGGYMVERRGAWLVERVEGDWLNVIGLPVMPLVGLLRGLGWRLGPRGPGPG